MTLRLAGLFLYPALGLTAGCFGDRPRPVPTSPDADSAQVSVEVLQPFDNATVIAGRPLLVDVLARGEGQALTGIGYVVRVVQGGARVDSGAIRFTARTLARDSFEVAVPAQLPTNTHLSIAALAFSAGRTRYSLATQVVVAQCTSDIPACR